MILSIVTLLDMNRIIKKENANLQLQNDSLSNENLETKIEVGRYEAAFDMFKDENPKAAKQYQFILENKVE